MLAALRGTCLHLRPLQRARQLDENREVDEHRGPRGLVEAGANAQLAWTVDAAQAPAKSGLDQLFALFARFTPLGLVCSGLPMSGLAPEHPEQHWLMSVEELAASLRRDRAGSGSPLTFLLGAGASISSGAPGTSEILASCRSERPQVFPTDEAVYEDFATALTPRERDAIIRPLFEDLEPYVGYRCLVAMARSRPVFVVNLNWDPSIKLAGDRIGVPVRSFDLSDVVRGRTIVAETLEQGRGVVCAHVHGHLADAYPEDVDVSRDDDAPVKRGIRLDRPATLSFQPEELELLRELLAHRTVVCGTSLIGPRDVHELVQALLPPLENIEQRNSVEPLWVFERGRASRAPGIGSRIAVGLSHALLTRHSINNFVSYPDVDFDTMLTVLRSAELGLPWSSVVQSHTQLPPLNELIPPNPSVVRSLLDKERLLLVGAPHVGASTLAYLLAWWQGLTDEQRSNTASSPDIVYGPQQALDYFQREDLPSAGALVIDNLFDERDANEGDSSLYARLGRAIQDLNHHQVIATASPDAILTVACHAGVHTRDALQMTVVWASDLWNPRDLRAWARARGGERAEIVCRQIRLGLIKTPSQAVRTYENHTPHEEEPWWSERLKRHLDAVYKHDGNSALLLALLRLQDFSVPHSEAALARLVGLQACTELVNDPWGLCERIEVDKEPYLRLNHPAIIRTVDDWLIDGHDTFHSKLHDGGGPARWAIDALTRWAMFYRHGDSSGMPDDLNPYELELFGSEYVRRSLQDKNPKLAIDSLWRIWKTAEDQWAAKDVAHDLVINWDAFSSDPRARKLRNALLSADREFGAYAMFEAIVRIGAPVPLELWTSVVSRLLDLAAKKRLDPVTRHQLALSLDTLLWRPSPVNLGQEHKLIRSLVDATKRNELLRVAVATACAYHFRGAMRLKEAGFDLEFLAGTDVSLPQAREMAWLVEWHFAHQSRCRAIASRRTFLSTSTSTAYEIGPRYLDRSLSDDTLDPEHEKAVSRVAEALLHHSETAGWALHLIMNVHSTTGLFRVSDETIAHLNAMIDPEKPCSGVISAAMTYTPTGQIVELLSRILNTQAGNQALQMRLGEGVLIDGTQTVEPRFSTSSDPWRIRDQWHATPRKLPFGVGGPTELIERLLEHLEEAVKARAVDREAALSALAIMGRGDTRAVEVWPQQEFKDGTFVDLLAFVAKYYAS